MSNVTATSGMYEVDLVFPRNETYTPQGVMPIVWAIQNPTLGESLVASLSWSMWEGNNITSPGSVQNGLIDLEQTEPYQFASSDPYTIIREINTLSYPEGVWTIAWTLGVNNCSAVGQPKVITQSGHTTVFTTSKSGNAPDLVAATSPETCSSIPAYAFNTTGTDLICGVFAPTATTSPCSVTINSTVESSIFAQATAFACSPQESSLYPGVTCPSSSAAGVTAAPALLMLIAILTTLTALIHRG